MGQSLSVPTGGGISYEAFSAYAVNEMKIPAHIVDVRATFDRHKDKNSDLISAETVLDLKLKTDVFLTHDWGIDELGRVNHDRVAAINEALKSLGFVTWFDSDRMTGNVVKQMVSGIDNASVIIVFVTQRYMNKVNGADANDNCYKEFNYATDTKSAAKMIPVVMEPRMKDIRTNWSGLTRMELGRQLYVDFSNDNDFQSAIQQLKAEILSRTNPLWVLRTTPVTTPPPPPTFPSTVSTPNDTDRLMIDQLSSWFGSIHISSSVARRYAELLVEKNSGSITKLQRRLERNANYLEEIGGFDEDDIIDIKEALIKKNNSGSGTENNNNGRNTSPSPPPPGFPLESQEIIKPVNSIFPEATVIDSQKNFLKEEKTTDSVHATGIQRRCDISLESHSGEVTSVSWSPVGNKIASGSSDKTIKIWDGKSLELLKTLTGHSRSVYSVSWNHDGSQIASGSNDNTIKIWDSSTGIVLRTLTGHSDLVRSVSWSHDDSKIVSGSDDETVIIWNAITGDLMKTLEGHSSWVTCVAWSPDDRMIASCSWNEKKIIIWDSLTGQVMNTVQPVEEVNSMAWNHDGSELAGNDDNKIKVFPFCRSL
jgi:WD40 repeat protein